MLRNIPGTTVSIAVVRWCCTIVVFWALGGCIGGSSDSGSVPQNIYFSPSAPTGTPKQTDVDPVSDTNNNSSAPYQLTTSFYYQDQLYNQNGLSGTTVNKPIRGASISAQNSSGNTIATASTNGSGLVQITSDQPIANLTVHATVTANGYSASVYSLLKQEYAYSVNMADIRNQIVVLGVEQSAVFNTLDVSFATFAYLVAMRQQQAAFAPLYIYWQPSQTKGTYYCADETSFDCPNGDGMYISDRFSDSDTFDDDIIWHEMGHYIETSLRIADTPGGFHQLWDDALDLRLAWSEGMATYFMAAIKQFADANGSSVLSNDSQYRTTEYIDTTARDAWLFDFVVPDTSGCQFRIDCFYYASNEVAVSRILWALDQAYGSQLVWNVMEQQMKPAADGEYWVNLEALWDGMMAQFAAEPAQQQFLQTVFSERKVVYAPDSNEPNDSAVAATPITCDSASNICATVTNMTLYNGVRQTDSDWYAITLNQGERYTLETINLVNGADTHIRLYDANKALLAEDDDNNNDSYWIAPVDALNDGNNLRSKLQFSPSTSAIYYLQVTTSPDQYQQAPFAGRYGGYDLRISRQ